MWGPFGVIEEGGGFFAAFFTKLKNAIFVLLNKNCAAVAGVYCVELTDCFEGCSAASEEIEDKGVGRLAGNFD